MGFLWILKEDLKIDDMANEGRGPGENLEEKNFPKKKGELRPCILNMFPWEATKIVNKTSVCI